MRKLFLLTLSAVVMNAAHSQEFTIKFGGGATWAGTNSNTIAGFQPLLSNDPTAVSQVLDPAYASIVNLANTISYGNNKGPGGSYQDTAGSKSLVHGSYARGWNFSGEVAYRVNPYFAVGIGFSYLFGSTITATQLYGNSVNLTLGDNTTVTTSTRAYGLSVTPNITVYAAKKGWRVKPYVRAGINLPLAGNVVDNIHINSPTALVNTTRLTSDLSVSTASKFSLGYIAAIGVCYNPIPVIGVWAEVNMTSINVAAKTSTLTEYVIDGTNLSTGAQTHADRINGTGKLPDIITALGGTNMPLTQYSKVIEYVDQLNGSNNTQDYGKARGGNGQAGYVNENQNHQEQRIFAPFSNIGVSIGITIHMSKKIFQDPTGRKAKEAATPQS